MGSWVSVEDRLPNKKGYYQILQDDLIKGRDGIERRFPYNAFYENGIWSVGDFAIYPAYPKYWQPLPEAPD